MMTADAGRTLEAYVAQRHPGTHTELYRSNSSDGWTLVVQREGSAPVAVQLPSLRSLSYRDWIGKCVQLIDNALTDESWRMHADYVWAP